MTMTMKSTLGVIGVGLLMLSVGCTERAGIAPTELASNTTVGGAATASADSYLVITLQPDLTADPPLVTVRAGDPVLMINNSAQFVRIRSSNCSEFSVVWLNPGASKYTWPFSPSGKKCDYFVWDWPNRVFEGQVAVN